jgi:hypothetical protein
MSWLFFQDESGHDHKNTPLEVRGGVALHSSKVWSFVQSMQRAEETCFGVRLADFGSELKGSKLLDKKRCEWALQETTLDDNERKNGVRRFLTKSQQGNPPSRRDFTAYGQASKLMASKIFSILKDHGAVLFASAIPRGAKPPPGYQFQNFLRKDLIFLQQRFFWFLEAKQECGLLVLDQTEKESDKRYVKRLQDYYTKTANGRRRAKWIVPYPMFVDSELSLAAQAADLCLYCINWGFRRPEWNFAGPKRDDIHREFSRLCGDLQFSGDAVENEKKMKLYGIIYVDDPYTFRPRFK